ncbi:hypothetical protein RN51_01710 [Microbacterium oxydans]|uniref:Uncharacterized protein n=1 Tax=Microbacterium oxydans TaxID=82380 RepID=A0A0F0KR59_9MICO|nr:hypothetical protein RN51_01710 [Microbacterium oxydans]
MFDIAPLLTEASGPLSLLALVVIMPIMWVAVLGTGPRGKNARKVLSIIFRRRPPG